MAGASGGDSPARRLFSCPVEGRFVQVWEQNGLRWLSLDHLASEPDTDCFQSAALIAHPHQAVLPTMKAMQLAFGCVNPQRALLLGLGGGDGARQLSYCQPDCIVDAVDASQAVITAFQECFQPLFHHRNIDRIVHESAAQFIDQDLRDHYDIVMCDVYQGREMADEASDGPFYSRLLSRLSDDGVLAVNLGLPDATALRDTLIQLRQASLHRTLLLPCESVTNVVVLCFKQSTGQSARSYLGHVFQSCQARGLVLPFEVEDVLRLNEKLDKGDLFTST